LGISVTHDRLTDAQLLPLHYFKPEGLSLLDIIGNKQIPRNFAAFVGAGLAPARNQGNRKGCPYRKT
jgi:hypothetical protein